MDIALAPAFERFVKAKIEAGEFKSPGDVVEAALSRMMLEPADDRISEEEVAQLRESVAQMRRGEVGEWPELSARIRAKYLGE